MYVQLPFLGSSCSRIFPFLKLSHLKSSSYIKDRILYQIYQIYVLQIYSPSLWLVYSISYWCVLIIEVLNLMKSNLLTLLRLALFLSCLRNLCLPQSSEVTLFSCRDLFFGFTFGSIIHLKLILGSDVR